MGNRSKETTSTEVIFKTIPNVDKGLDTMRRMQLVLLAEVCHSANGICQVAFQRTRRLPYVTVTRHAWLNGFIMVPIT
jgi:hypothetical protein